MTSNKWIVILLFSLFFVSSRNTAFFLEQGSSDILFLQKTWDGETSSFSRNSLASLQDLAAQYLSTAQNPMTKLYEEPLTQWLVEDFLTEKASSQEIANTVLVYTLKNNLPIKIVFSLIFVESRFSLQAVNVNTSSRDLGLFQLNSNTFRHLTPKDFFHLETNVKMGTEYLAYAFRLDPDPSIALAIYNAGPSRPLRGKTPLSTKKYVKKILTHSQKLEKEFRYYVWKKLNLSQVSVRGNA